MSVTISGTNGIDKVQDGTIQSADFAAGVPSASNLPAGTVLQVVNATYASEVNSTSSTFADTGLTATITPTSASSKILVMVQQACVGKRAGDTYVDLRLVKNGSTVLASFGGVSAITADTGWVGIGNCGLDYLDSPATTSAVTYKTQFANHTASGYAYVQWAGDIGPVSTITLMEIAA